MNNHIGKILTNRNGHEYLLLAYNEKEDKMLLQKIGYNSFVVCYGLKSLAEKGSWSYGNYFEDYGTDSDPLQGAVNYFYSQETPVGRLSTFVYEEGGFTGVDICLDNKIIYQCDITPDGEVRMIYHEDDDISEFIHSF